MALILSIIVNLILIGVCFGLVLYLIKFARIIMAIEDSMENALEDLNTTEGSLIKLLKMQMFFESKDVQLAVKTVLDDVKLSQIAVHNVIKDFTRLSKQKYEMVTINENNKDTTNTAGEFEDNFE